MHFHPSVKVSAAALMEKDRKMAKPDLESHSLIRFLDKLVYKNPKSTDVARGASIMQPLRATKDLGDEWLGSRSAGATAAPVNSAAFWKKKVEEVAAEDIFFHEYFQHVVKGAKEPTAKAPTAGDEDGDEDEIWEALVSTQPDIEADGSDDGFDELDELDMASEDGSSPSLSLDSDVDEDEDEDEGEGESEDEGSADGLEAVGEGDGAAKDKTAKTAGSRRKALRDLPLFASVDDYAELLAGERDEAQT